MTVKDVEMKDATKTNNGNEKKKKEQTPAETAALISSDILQSLNLLIRGVLKRDDRLIGRAARQVLVRRRKLAENPAILKHVIQSALTHKEHSSLKEDLLKYLSAHESSTDDINKAEDPLSSFPLIKGTSEKVPEVSVLLQLLVVTLLIDKEDYDNAVNCSSQLIHNVQDTNRHSMDLLAARAYFYYSRSYELSGRLYQVRSTLLSALRTASLRYDSFGQLMLLNLLLRNYLTYNLYDQAIKLVEKTNLPETRANNQTARYYYYLGKIKSIQLEYSEAYDCLNQAIRKAPTSTAHGFKLTVYKLLAIVQLLMGEIPERNIFLRKAYKKELEPYLKLVQTVRVGDLEAFRNVVSEYQNVFKADNNYTLIQRVRQNVIKTGLRKISLSYSRISLKDVVKKLHLDNPEDCEFIVAKAIKDGVIDATIDHSEQYVQSKETIDVYSSTEPADAFRKRIRFCLNVHNEAVKAMRFPPNSHHDELETDEEREKRLQEEKEIVAAVEEGEEGDEEDDEGMDF
eukprot:gb/GECH01012173.1/.p1 GENE.gb/GECH01012173.1/~~gb/GECH01012173.1/.p1  ORF type:complete len:514 (+),score=144.21 gb/GECH01012173.1/:1-1542(+)